MTVLEQRSKIKVWLLDSGNFRGNQFIHDYSCSSTFRNELFPIEKVFYSEMSLPRSVGGG